MNIDQLSDFLLEVSKSGAAVPNKLPDKREENHLKKKFLNKVSF